MGRVRFIARPRVRTRSLTSLYVTGSMTVEKQNSNVHRRLKRASFVAT